MKKYCLIYAMATMWMLSTMPLDARQVSDEGLRQALMDREMDCIDQHLNSGEGVTWENTCSSQYSGADVVDIARADNVRSYEETPTIADTMDPGQVELMGSSGNYSQLAERIDSDWGREYDDGMDIYGDRKDSGRYDGLTLDEGDSSDWLDPKLTTLDIGIEASHYRYAEPEFMRLKGYLWGIFGAFTFRTSENKHIKTVGDIFSEDNSINMFRLDAKFSGGDLDYESEGTGMTDDLRNYMFELRGNVGYDIPLQSASRITPYAGFGFRYLKDDSGGHTTTTGASHYDRESFYYYIPLGIETQTKFNHSWLLEMTFEYDYFLFGAQKSHMEDVLAGYNTLVNDQDKGYGARGSFKLIKQDRNVNFYIEPFIRYWNIEDSDIDILTYFDVPVSAGIEPANNTTEYGIKTGLRF